jgi:hypothetical protein
MVTTSAQATTNQGTSFDELDLLFKGDDINNNAASVDELEALFGAPVQPQGQAGQPAVEPEPNLGFFDKVNQSFGKRVSSMGDTLSSFAQGVQEDGFAAPAELGRDPTKTRASDVVLQVGGDALGFLFDTVGAGVSEGAEKLWSVLPEAVTSTISEEAKEAGTAFLNSDAGKQALMAWNAGGDVLEEYKKTNPVEYKSLAGLINVASGAGLVKAMGNASRKVGQNFRLRDLGNRQITAPLKGRDADVFSIVSDTSRAGRTRSLESTTSGGTMSSSQRLLLPDEENMLDAAVKVKGLNSAKPFQENYNLIKNKIVALGTNIESKLSKVKGSIPVPEIRQTIRANLQKVIKENPAVFGSKTKTQLKIFGDMEAQLLKIIDDNGTTALGLHRSRQAFDAYYEKLAAEAHKQGTSMPSGVVESYRSIRKSMNGLVDSMDPDTKALRMEQSGLIQAKQNMIPKVLSQAQDPLGRYFQAIGLADPKTGQAIVGNIPFKLGAIAISPAYFAGKQFQKIWRSAPIQTPKGRAAYTLRYLMDMTKKGVNELKDPVLKNQIRSDIILINSMIQELNREAAEEKKAGAKP